MYWFSKGIWNFLLGTLSSPERRYGSHAQNFTWKTEKKIRTSLSIADLGRKGKKTNRTIKKGCTMLEHRRYTHRRKLQTRASRYYIYYRNYDSDERSHLTWTILRARSTDRTPPYGIRSRSLCSSLYGYEYAARH